MPRSHLIPTFVIVPLVPTCSSRNSHCYAYINTSYSQNNEKLENNGFSKTNFETPLLKKIAIFHNFIKCQNFF